MIAVAELASRLNLRATPAKGQTEWHGPNPWENGAQNDGFILFADGQAWDRSIERNYTSWDVAKNSGIPPEEYEPIATYLSSSGASPQSTSKNAASRNGTTRNGMPRETKAVIKPKTYDTRSLQERGFSPTTLAHFKIVQRTDPALGLHYDYPTRHANGTAGRSRRKWIDPRLQAEQWPDKSPCKYWWLKDAKNLGIPDGYNLDALTPSALKKPLWIVNGEPAVWACHQEGVLAVAPLGEKRNLGQFITALVELGVTRAHLVPDNDDTGMSGAQRLAQLGQEAGLQLVIHQWPVPTAALKSGYDVCDYWEECRATEKPLAQALLDLPRWVAPKVEMAKPETPDQAPRKTRSAPASDGEGSPNVSTRQAQRLMTYLENLGMELFQTTDKEAFLYVRSEGGNHETLSVGSTDFTYFCDDLWHRNDETAFLKRDTLETVARVLTGRALRCGQVIDVSPRVASRGTGRGQKIYLDLCNRDRTVVEVFAGGWRLVQHVPGLHFRRPPGMKPLPVPVLLTGDDAENTWDKLRDLLGCGHEKNFVLMISWLLGCLRGPDAPYPALAVSGEQDSGKTEKSKMLRCLIDPNVQELADTPENPRDLAISAKNRLILGYDNLVGIPMWLSNAFCRIATMGCFATRKLHTNDEEMLFHATRPLMINGIADFLGRADFQRRCLFVQLPRFGQEGTGRKRPVRLVWREFAEIAPAVLGLLLQAVGAAIEHSEDEELDEIEVEGGLYDFAQWVVGAERGGALPWAQGLFMEAYKDSQQSAALSSLDAILPASFQRLARMLRQSGQKQWHGTANQLWDLLAPIAAVILIGEAHYYSATEMEREHLLDKGRELLRKAKDFPTNGTMLGREVRAIAPRLRENRLFDVRFERSTTERTIALELLDTVGEPPAELAPDYQPETKPQPSPPIDYFDPANDPFGDDDEN